MTPPPIALADFLVAPDTWMTHGLQTGRVPNNTMYSNVSMTTGWGAYGAHDGSNMLNFGIFFGAPHSDLNDNLGYGPTNYTYGQTSNLLAQMTFNPNNPVTTNPGPASFIDGGSVSAS